MHNSDLRALSTRDRAWLAGLFALLLVWVFLLGMWVAGMRQPGGLLGGPALYAIPPGYHLVRDLAPIVRTP